MKRIIWISIILTLAGLFLPLAFLERVSAEETPQNSPSLPSDDNPASERPLPQTTYIDSELYIDLLTGGETRRLSMAEYLPYAVAAEMPVSFEAEALKSQAIAARTYVVYCTLNVNPKHPDSDICTDYSCCLAYLEEAALRGNWGENFEANMEKIETACSLTDGLILRYEDKPILATFHSSSAGKTETGEALWGAVPYLKSVSSPETAEDVPNFVSTVEVSVENLRESVLLLCPETNFDLDPADWLSDIQLDDNGRVRSVVICGSTLSGAEMRKLFSLRSTAFTLEYNGSFFVFTVSGYGHGLGMSQYGANVMAKNGLNCEEILSHYYPNTILA